jgi:hypothetical protein
VTEKRTAVTLSLHVTHALEELAPDSGPNRNEANP